MVVRIAYLGPDGTFGSEAVVAYDKTAVLVAARSNEEVLRKVAKGEAQMGVAPIENSVEGTVTAVADELIHNGDGLVIVAEILLPVRQCLIVPKGLEFLQAVEAVYSHPQALAQCRGYIENNMPDVRQVPTLSTAGAVREAMEATMLAAAIAPARAAQLHPGAALFVEGIQDRKNNTTRFIVVGREAVLPTGYDKTSLCVIPKGKDKPGTLYWILGEFARLDINLTKQESRPTRETLGEYVFLIDLEGHQKDPKVREALEGVRRQVDTLKVFGSYPRWRNGS